MNQRWGIFTMLYRQDHQDKINKKKEAAAKRKAETTNYQTLLDNVRDGLFNGKGKAWALEILPLMEEAINDMEEIQNTYHTIAVAFGAEAANNYLQENMGWTVEILQQILNESKQIPGAYSHSPMQTVAIVGLLKFAV